MHEHSRQSRSSHGGDSPPFRGRDGYLSSTWYCSRVEEVLLFEEMIATNHTLGIAGFLHFFIPPNFQEDETLLRETLENRCRSLSAEKHVHIVSGQVDCQAAAESLMVQGVGVINGAESESFPRGRDCSTSAEKHMFIVFAS